MSSDINLLVEKDKKLLKEQRKLKVFRLIAIGSLVVLLLISASVPILNQQLSDGSIEEDRDSILSEMLPFREKEAKLTIVNNRIDNISKVVNKRVDVYKIINTLLGQAPEGILVYSLEFTEKQISMKISSGSLGPVDGLINNLVDMAKKKEIIKVLTLDSLVTELARGYIASINIGI